MHWLDPSVLPVVKGKIVCFTRNLNGDADGVLLDDDRQIHLPLHLGARFEELFAPGDPIEARYIKPRVGDVFAAVSVSNAAGVSLVDDGPLHKKPGHHDMAHSQPKVKDGRHAAPVDIGGTVRRALFAPKGEVAGAVLQSGEQLRVDPKANADLAPYFEAGAEIRVWGDAMEHKGTTIVEVGEVGFSKDFD